MVQETLRMVLNAVYEPEFKQYNTNTGFRPNCSCANAIDNIVEGAKKNDFDHALEGDIEGAFDNMNHQILIEILRKKIKDKHLLQLIKEGLTAGIMDDGTEKDTILGVIQGSIVSPIIFNIYMHEFDKYIINDILKEYITPNSTKEKVLSTYETLGSRLQRAKHKIQEIQNNPQVLKMNLSELISTIESDTEKYFNIRIQEKYQKIKEYNEVQPSKNQIIAHNKYNRLRKIKTLHNQEESQKDSTLTYTTEEKALINAQLVRLTTNTRNKKWLMEATQDQWEDINQTRKNNLTKKVNITKSTILKTPYIDPTGRNTKIHYSRYADDWILLIRGTEQLVEEIKEKITQFLKNNLKFTLSPKKTKITNLRKEKAHYLGFELFYQINPLIISRTLKGNNRFTQRHQSLQIHPDTERLSKRFLTNKLMNKEGLPREIGFLTVLQDHEIILKYNQKMIGIGNYYIRQITYPSKLNRWHYILYYSCLKTLAAKHRRTVKATIKHYGYLDISLPQPKYNIPASAYRIVTKYKIDQKTKYNVLLSYKEFMMKIKELKDKPPPKGIDPLSLYKINLRTAFKLTTACAICGSKEKIENHHIKPIKHSGGIHKGFKGFDKVIASLGRKQIPVCQECHKKIHQGKYNDTPLNELYDLRLIAPEGLIRFPKEIKETSEEPTSKERESYTNQKKPNHAKTAFLINEKKRTYSNMHLKYYYKKNYESNPEQPLPE
jgi:retron-type reverse transcriptase